MNEFKSGKRNEIIGGGVLILLGLMFLVGQLLPPNMGLLIPLLLGIVFLAWGIVARHAGPIIPGGILLGVGVGVLLTEVFFPRANEAIFLFGFAGGWVVITLASALFTRETQWWPLIVATIMLVVAAAAMFGGFLLTILSWMGTLWPLIPITIGLWIVLRQTVGAKEKGKDIT
ncbi:MAG: hypothetical protein V9G20_19360 [Candidatus Promineifilaceae bacterium]